MEDVKVDSRTADVSDGTLSVELDGELTKDWKASFAKTSRLLGSGNWGELRLKKRTVTVKGLSEGEEDKLRHHLEGIVAQANETLRTEEESEPAVADDGEGEAEGDGADGPDADMTERFRAFGAEDDPD